MIGVVGATASGKTSLAIKIAQKYDGEIISADSMQIYKGMNIATAKPDKEEMCGIPHHIMDFLVPEETFSVSQYVEMAKSKTEDILSRGKIPIVCGGTGLYVRSLVENIQFSPEQADENLRNELNERYEKEGGEVLLKELAEFDEDIAKTLHPSNNKRIIRAIEIYQTTGITMSEHIRKSKSIPSPYEWTVLGIAYRDRQKLYDRINARVDRMLSMGLLEETREFYQKHIGKTAVGANTPASPVQPARSRVGQSVGMSQKLDRMLHMLLRKRRFTSAFPHSKKPVCGISEYTAIAVNSAPVRSISVSTFA